MDETSVTAKEKLGREIAQAQEYARRRVAFLLRNCPGEIDDVLQDAALRAVRTRSRFRGESAFTSWFTRIVVNSALIHLRSGQSHRSRVTASLDDSREFISRAQNPEQMAIRAERSDMLMAAVRKLPRTLREAADDYLRGVPCSDNVLKARRFRARHAIIENVRSAV